MLAAANRHRCDWLAGRAACTAGSVGRWCNQSESQRAGGGLFFLFSMWPIRGEISQQIAAAPSVSGSVLWFDPMKLAWNNRPEPSASLCSLSLLFVPQLLFRCNPSFPLSFVSSSSLIPLSFCSHVPVFNYFSNHTLISPLPSLSLFLKINFYFCGWRVWREMY